MIAVFIEQSPQPGRNEELANNTPFADFVGSAPIPSETVVCWSSAGGLASVYFAFQHPQVFGRVLAQSAALWPGKTRDNPDHEWLTKQYEATPRSAVHFALQVGALAPGGPTPPNGPSILVANRHLRDVLKAKG